MNPLNFGSGAALLGGQDPIQEAMARRATGQAGVTAQSSQSQTPMPQPAAGQAPSPQQPQMPPTDPIAGQAQAAPQKDPLSFENEIIIKGLLQKLKSNSTTTEVSKQPTLPTGGF